MAESRICSIDGCSNPSKARGWCGKHWTRWRHYGDPTFVQRDAKLELTGKRFGRLVARKDTGERKQRQSVWLCRCDCGKDIDVQAGNLQSGNTKSCGCLRDDLRLVAPLKHGGARSIGHSVEYTTWWSMIARCKYPSTHAYPWYGGRGIKVCDRWSGDAGFAHFLADMGLRPGDGWSIDRIDPDGEYEPANCRWLPMAENAARARRPVRRVFDRDKQREERNGP